MLPLLDISHALPIRRKNPLSSSSSNPAIFNIEMSSSSRQPPSLPPLPDNQIVLGCGGLSLDFLATVAEYPKPDDKIRSTSLKVEGGGNVGNALTCAARLGLKPRIISKVVNDDQGRSILAELEANGVDTSFMVVAEEGNSPFTYVIVDNQMKTRTCIHTPGYPPLMPDEISKSNLSSALDGVRLACFDVRLHETALILAQEAKRMGIPILVDAERKREGLDDILNLASYVVCPEKFPQSWTTASSIPRALVSMLLRLPSLKFVIATLGEKGCIMLERSHEEDQEVEEIEVDNLLESLQQKVDRSAVLPTCVFSEANLKIRAEGIGAISGRLLVGTAEKIPPPEIIDTTGAGDAFVGAVQYALCAGMPPEKMLPFASQVAALGCRVLGARSGLPWRTNPRLLPFLP